MAQHTYTVHLTIGADDDASALAGADKIVAAIGRAIAAGVNFADTPNGYVVDSVLVTDADDWAEQINEAFVCSRCGKFDPASDRLRDGSGNRICPSCLSASKFDPYPIEDVTL